MSRICGDAAGSVCDDGGHLAGGRSLHGRRRRRRVHFVCLRFSCGPLDDGRARGSRFRARSSDAVFLDGRDGVSSRQPARPWTPSLDRRHARRSVTSQLCSTVRAGGRHHPTDTYAMLLGGQTLLIFLMSAMTVVRCNFERQQPAASSATDITGIFFSFAFSSILSRFYHRDNQILTAILGCCFQSSYLITNILQAGTAEYKAPLISTSASILQLSHVL